MSKHTKTSYYDAIEEAMKSNSGYATLRFLYKNVWIYKDKKSIKGRTPNNTIQERVQRDKRFIRIGIGLYALREYMKAGRIPSTTQNKKQERTTISSTHGKPRENHSDW